MTAWKGGRGVRPDGYVWLRMRDHPRASSEGQVLEHHVVVEERLGHRLRSSAEIHHINGDKQDNRPQNLVVCHDSTYHKLLHRRQAALDACGNPNWRKCKYCGQHDDPANMRDCSITGGKEHRGCKLKWRRERHAELHPGVRPIGEYSLSRVRGGGR